MNHEHETRAPDEHVEERVTRSDVYDYIRGSRVEGLPDPPDSYTPGPTKWGADVKRSRAITRRRETKRDQANLLALIPHLSELSSRLEADAWTSLAQEFAQADRDDVACDCWDRSGMNLWRAEDGRSAILAPGDHREEQVRELGGTKVMTREKLLEYIKP